MSDILEVRGLTHQYENATILTFQDVSFKLASGQLLAILGASGSGKSTFLRCIAGLEVPSRGSVTLGGVKVVADGETFIPAEARGIGMVFQDYALFPSMTVRENILFGVSDRRKHERVLERWTELLRLDGLLERMPASLSGGQQQRVALARALAPEPKLLLLDEPFANLDGNLREEVGHELRGLFAGGEMTVILVTHDRSEAFALADQIAVFGVASDAHDSSSLKQLEVPQRLYRCPVDLEVTALTGQASVLSGHLESLGQVRVAGTSFAAVGNQVGEVDVMIRPDDAEFVPEDSGTWTVTRRVYSGGQYYLWVSRNDEVVRLHVDEDQAPLVGAFGELRAQRPLWTLPKA